MKNLKILLCLLVLIPTMVNAEEVTEKSEIILDTNITETNNLNGSGYYIANEAEINNTINGAVFSLANSLDYNGQSDYGIILANDLTLNGSIKNDGFIVGNTIKFTEDFLIERDLLVLGNIINLQGQLKRDVTIKASEVILENVTITGTLDIQAATIVVKDNVTVQNFSYNEDADITGLENVVTNITTTEALFTTKTIKDYALEFIYNYGTSLLTFALIALIVPALFKRIEQKYENLQFEKMIMTLGLGGVATIAIPIVAVLLMTLLLGIKIGIIIIGLFISIFFLTEIFASYLLGYYINKYIIKKQNSIYISGLIGITIITLLSYIPVINVFIVLIASLLSVGIALNLFTKN